VICLCLNPTDAGRALDLSLMAAGNQTMMQGGETAAEFDNKCQQKTGQRRDKTLLHLLQNADL